VAVDILTQKAAWHLSCSTMCILETKIIYKPRGISQADSHRTLTVEAWAHSQVSPCGICGGQSGNAIRFSSSISDFPPVSFPQSSILIHSHDWRYITSDLLDDQTFGTESKWPVWYAEGWNLYEQCIRGAKHGYHQLAVFGVLSITLGITNQ
jgi:hypothetical protein